MSWLPNKLIPYALGFIVIGLLILFARKRSRVIANTVLLGWFVTFFILFYFLVRPDINFLPALLIIITYSAFYPVLVIPTKYLASRELLSKMLNVLTIVVFVQAAVATIQFLYGVVSGAYFLPAGADMIEGTIHPQLRGAGGGFDNAIFAIGVGFALLALPLNSLLFRRHTWMIFAWGFSMFVAAKVVHVAIFLMIALLSALVFSVLWNFKFKRFHVQLLFVVILIVSIFPFLLPEQVSRGQIYLSRALEGNNPKIIVTEKVITQAPSDYPFFPLLGIGPGQVASRASLMASGQYIGGATVTNPRPLPFLPDVYVSKALELYIMDQWTAVRELPYSAGTTLRPFYSLLSVFSEFGLLALLAVFAFTAHIILRTLRHMRSREQKFMGISLIAAVLFLVLMGVAENYWELPQAILPGLLMIKVLYANVCYPYLNHARASYQDPTSVLPSASSPRGAAA